MRRSVGMCVLVLSVCLTTRCPPGWAQCTPEWARAMFPVPGFSNPVRALCVYNGELYAAGDFTTAGNVVAKGIAKSNGTSWQPVGTGMGGVTSPTVYALCVYNNELYAGGRFTTAGGVIANGIARWDGVSWQPVGAGMTSYVYALCVYNGDLYAGGDFTTAGGAPAYKIAKWNGVSWQAVGVGIGGDYPHVDALCVYNGELYAGGDFTTAGGSAAKYIARWNGVLWQPVGTGMNLDVAALCVYSGELYAGGRFTTAGGAPANYIAKWNGVSWQPLGTGMDRTVYALCVYNGELYAGGYFTTAGGMTANYVAKWNAAFWEGVGGGLSGADRGVLALCVYDDGLGPAPALYAGGWFTQAGDSASARIARWGCEDALADAASAKSHPDGRLASITGDISTAVFGDAFYLSHVSNGVQASGIRAEMAGHGVTRDKLTSITGRTRTTADGERYMDAWSATCGASASVKPEFMPLKSLGGGPCGCQDGVWGWIIEKDLEGKPKRVWGRERGINNIGMLVRVCGRLTYINEHTFTLDDGAGIAVHCVTPTDVTANPLWQYVVVTGISSCERVGEELHRKVLVRSAGDIQVIL